MNQKINAGKTFSLQNSDFAKFGKSLLKATDKVDREMERRMNRATALVFNLATQRRPYISKQHQKQGFRTRSGNIHHNRVSDPNAKQGVPVAFDAGGMLRSAIQQKVTRGKGSSFTGEIWVDGNIAPYGKYMEYGTAKIHARPFMRPAVNGTRAAIKSLFKDRVEIKR